MTAYGRKQPLDLAPFDQFEWPHWVKADVAATSLVVACRGSERQAVEIDGVYQSSG